VADHAPKPIAPEVIAWTQREMLTIASRAIGKVARGNERAATLLSIDEIMAMTGTLIGLGLIATLPGEAPPETLIYTPERRPNHGQ
jgi:hypothetical protein